MKKYIIFLCKDTRPVKEVNGVIDEHSAIAINKVAKKSFKKYQVGDYLSITLQDYTTVKGSHILRDKIVRYDIEEVLCKVHKIFKNVVYVNIVGEKEYEPKVRVKE